MAPRPGKTEAAYIAGIVWSDRIATSWDANESASSAATQRNATRTRCNWPRRLSCPESKAAKATSTKLSPWSGPARRWCPSAISSS